MNEATAQLAPRTFVATKRRLRLDELWRSYPVARVVASRDVKIKYKQSLLGPIWLFMQPLGMLAAVSVAFSAVAGVHTGDVPYVLFALVGLSVWMYIQLAVSAATMALIINAQLVRRSPCPRLALIHGSLISNLPPLGVTAGVTLIAIAASRWFPLQALLFPVLVAWLLVVAWSVSVLIATLAARFRDMVSAVPLFIQAGVFLSPVGYPVHSASGVVKALLALNPLSGVMDVWRWSLLGLRPTMGIVFAALGWTVVLAIGAWRVFTRMETTFADFV